MFLQNQYLEGNSQFEQCLPKCSPNGCLMHFPPRVCQRTREPQQQPRHLYLCPTNCWPPNLHFLSFQMVIILSWPLLKRIIEGKNFPRWTLALGTPYRRLLAFLHADLDFISQALSLSCTHSFPLSLPVLHPFQNPKPCCLSRWIAGPSFITRFTGH